jgi:hypothetical protein
MSLKWIALGMILLGIAGVLSVSSSEERSSDSDGQIVRGASGLILFVLGCLLMLVALFIVV